MVAGGILVFRIVNNSCMKRRYDLDWLRVIAFALLMLFHTGMMFSTWDWHIKNLETSRAFDVVMQFLHAWRMPLLFFISGSAVWFATDRYSTWRFFLERQKRLLLPLIFGLLVVIPPQVYIERLFNFQKFDSFWDFYRTVFTTGSYPEGNLSWHHLWYIPYIWVYSMLVLPLVVLLRSNFGRALLGRVHGWLEKPWTLFLLFIPSAISDILVRPFYPGDHMNLIADWGNFSHKLTFFVIGFLLASGTAVYDTIAGHRRKFLVLGFLSLVGVEMAWLGWWQGQVVLAYRVLLNFLIWMWLLALLGYGRHYLSFNHPVLRYANEAVYPFYILHQTIIVAIGYQLVYANTRIASKFLIVAAGTFLFSWILYEYLIKRVKALRVVFGLKAKVPSAIGVEVGLSEGPPLSKTGFRTRLFARWKFAVVLVLPLVLFSARWHSEGRLVCHMVEAPSLSTNRFGISSSQPIAVYLPPSYGEPDRRFPVLYLLPNFKHNLWRYTAGSYQGFRLKGAMNQQIQHGLVGEMIVVVPNANHWLGGSWYHNSPLSSGWEDFIALDVVNYMDTHFKTVRAAPGRAIAGHGMGGYGALEIALRHADVFGSVYAMSPPLFAKDGLRDSGLIGDNLLVEWSRARVRWSGMAPEVAGRAFREFLQTRLNSPSWRKFMEGLSISYAAAVSPNLQLPYPHVEFPEPGHVDKNQAELTRRFESGFGDWQEKLTRCIATGARVPSITLEHGGEGEYDWVRRGAEDLSGLMSSMGVAHKLTVHSGGHDSRLGERLEQMLPTVSKSLMKDR